MRCGLEASRFGGLPVFSHYAFLCLTLATFTTEQGLSFSSLREGGLVYECMGDQPAASTGGLCTLLPSSSGSVLSSLLWRGVARPQVLRAVLQDRKHKQEGWEDM